MNVDVDNYKGHATFNDVEDYELRQRNRTVVMVNMLTANKPLNGKLRTGVVVEAINYFRCIPREDRKELLTRVNDALLELGMETGIANA